MSNGVVLARLIDEYGNLEQEKENQISEKAIGNVDEAKGKLEGKKAGAALMSIEERATGAVTWSTYSNYLQSAGGILWAPTILILLTLAQGAQGYYITWLHVSFVFDLSYSWQQSIPWLLDLRQYLWV